MYNFLELKQEVAKLAQRSGDTDYIAKMNAWINFGCEMLYKLSDTHELEDIHNFTTVASQESYIMPERLGQPLRVYDLTNDRHLTIKDELTYFDESVADIADSTTTTVPEFARIYGISPVDTQISTSGDTTKIKSSSSSDTTQTVRVEGFLDSAQTVVGFENISLNGTTEVAGSTTFYKIIHVSKSADTVGYVSLLNSSSTALVNIAPIERVVYRKVMKLGLIPSQANSMRVLFKRKFRKLVNDNDYPLIEADEFYILNAWGFALSEEKETAERAQQIWSRADKALTPELLEQANQLGPDFNRKYRSSLIQGHRS